MISAEKAYSRSKKNDMSKFSTEKYINVMLDEIEQNILEVTKSGNTVLYKSIYWNDSVQRLADVIRNFGYNVQVRKSVSNICNGDDVTLVISWNI